MSLPLHHHAIFSTLTFSVFHFHEIFDTVNDVSHLTPMLHFDVQPIHCLHLYFDIILNDSPDNL